MQNKLQRADQRITELTRVEIENEVCEQVHKVQPTQMVFSHVTCRLLTVSGHEIAPNTVANATKITALATKIQKLVAKLATRTLQVLSILP